MLGRLIFPASERQTWQWAQHRSAVYELAGTPLKGSLNSFYRATDTVFQHKDTIEAHLSKKEKEIFSLAETLCLFDLTNTHFDGFHYIVVNRGKSDFTPDDTAGMKIIRKEDEFTVEVCRKQKDEEVFLLCRSTGRIEKDRGIRSRQEQHFVERLTYYRNGLLKKRMTIEFDVKEQQEARRCHLRICSRPEPEQSMIYHRLGLSGTPLGRRMYIAK